MCCVTECSAPFPPTAPDWDITVYMFVRMAPVGIAVITLALWPPRPAHWALQNHKQEPQLLYLDGAPLQWRCFSIITSNVAKWISLTTHLFPSLLHLAESITEEIVFSQQLWNGTGMNSVPVADQNTEVCMDEKPGQTDTERQPWRDKDKMSFSIAFASLFFSSCMAKSSIPQQITCLLTPPVSASLHSAPQAHLLLICFFLITSGNWKVGSLVNAAHCYISLPSYN